MFDGSEPPTLVEDILTLGTGAILFACLFLLLVALLT